ncbi:MAG: Bug family tripartite tricarboxylate transporter substrate binding protein [Betaproteobacteria bacterium]|jgi:tripartite-type tricarboxylate transporter receptor subunit TctC|nr:tripartite tricarboxylate transporter substrate binding protein [Betaproteobacteria bacterium]
MTQSPSIRRPFAGAFAGLAALCATPALHAGSDFPSRPVRIIVGFPPGGATDFVARSIAPRLGEALKQQVVIDNRAGANGTIAAELASNATPDGYNLHLGTLGALVISPAISKVGYDPQRDLLPISLAVKLQNIFIAHPGVAAKTVTDLIALAKQKPGTINYASSGLGSPGHLAGELLKAMTKIDLQHVPYRGGAPALGDLVSGQVPIFVAVISTGVPVINSGRAIALAVTGAKRSPALPEVPTVAETPALKGYEASNWYGLMAPAATPRPIIDRLHRDMVSVMDTPVLRDLLAARGVDATSSTPDEFAAYIRSETAKWGKVIRAANLTPN